MIKTSYSKAAHVVCKVSNIKIYHWYSEFRNTCQGGRHGHGRWEILTIYSFTWLRKGNRSNFSKFTCWSEVLTMLVSLFTLKHRTIHWSTRLFPITKSLKICIIYLLVKVCIFLYWTILSFGFYRQFILR